MLYQGQDATMVSDDIKICYLTKSHRLIRSLILYVGHFVLTASYHLHIRI